MRVIEHNMAEELAIRLLGWKWVSFVGIPVKGTEGYPNKCRVRQLMSAAQLKNKEWQAYLQDHQGADATGDEPLAYTYCSSGRNDARLPRFTILVDD